MGEIMAMHEAVAEEYVQILLSYVQEDAIPWKMGLLERGVLWGWVGLLRPGLICSPKRWLLHSLSELRDPVHRGLAAWTLRCLDLPCLPPHLSRSFGIIPG